MIARLLLAVSAAVLLGGAAPRDSLERFAVDPARGWPQVLAVCDLSRFLLEQPSLDADVIYARARTTGWLRPLYGPRFVPQNLLYDEDLRRTFHRVERAGEVDRRSVGEARFAVDTPMLRRFRRMGAAERRFLRDQSDTCRALEDDARARFPVTQSAPARDAIAPHPPPRL